MIINMKKLLSQHYLILILIIFLGAILRFSYLDFKPFGIDEVITTIFSLGLSYDVIPQNQPISLTELAQIFQLNPHQSCAIIAQNLINQSTHPPLFFCGMHYWLNLIDQLSVSLLTKVRSFPALIGVLSIALMYVFNRVAFSKKAGLIGALMMAISPFHLYLSQEARHYTLPIFIILISLTLWLKLIQNIKLKKLNYLIWISWILINSLSLYIHYFSAIALVAEYLSLLIILTQHKLRQIWLYLASSILTLSLFLPWLSIILNHANNDKTNWLSAPEGLSPLFQSIIAWILMIIALPIEEQSLTIQILMGILTLILTGSFLYYLIPKFKILWKNYPSTFPLILFIGIVLSEFIVIVYFLKKDITIAPRYHFIYYPAVCAILGASLSISPPETLLKKLKKIKLNDQLTLITILIVSLISCYFVLINLALNKPYRPEFVSKLFNQSSENLMIVMAYEHSTEMALGLGYALTLEQISKAPKTTNLLLLDTSKSHQIIWQKIPLISTTEDQLWIIAPGLLESSFPDMILRVKGRHCDRNQKQYYRIGFPFQGYICSKD